MEPTPSPERPGITPGYGISGERDGLIGWADVVTRLAESRNYWIGTTRPDGRPHASPVWGVVLDDEVVFGTDRDSVKARNLADGSAVALHLESGDEAVIVEGVAEPVKDRETLRRAGRAFREKYGIDVVGDGDEGVFFVLKPTKAFAWMESEFPTTATRFRFDPNDSG